MGPYKLVTVNNAPERAQRLVGRVVEIVKDRYVINHVANAESEATRKDYIACVTASRPLSSKP